MEAYIVGVIGGDKQILNQRDCTFRVLDLSPDIINRVCDVPRERFINILDSGVTMPGITVSRGNVYYHTCNILDCVPNLKSSRAVSKKLTALRQVYSEDGYHEIILADCRGKLSKIPLSEVVHNDLAKLILNVRFEKTEYTDKFPIITIGSDYYKLLTPDNKLLQTIGSPDSSKMSTNVGIDNKYKTGQKIFDDWIDLEYFDSMMCANNILHNISAYSLKKIDGQLPVLNIPMGLSTVESYAISTKDNARSNIKVIRIPNTITVLEKGCFDTVETPVKVIWQERGENNLALCAQGMNDLLKETSDYDVSKIVPLNLTDLSGLFFSTLCGSGNFESLSNLEKLGFVCKENMRLYDGIILPDSLKELQYSFMSCDLFDKNYENSLYRSNNDELGFITNYNVKIPSSIESIKQSFITIGGTGSIDFSACDKLTTIDTCFNHIPELKKIDLSKCTELKRINDAFMGLKELEEVILPEGLTSIGDHCFSGCTNLKSIVLPESLTEIGYDAFSGSGITELRIPASVKVCRESRDISKIFSPRESIDINITRFGYDESDTKIVFESVKKINREAFRNININKVEFPDDISELETGCFNAARGDLLNMYNWKVTSIPDDCFNSSGIAKIILPSNLETLGDAALVGLERLGKMFIPGGLIKFGRKNLAKVGSSLVGGTEYYTVEGSPVEKELLKANKRVYSFETDEEAINKMLGLEGTSSDKAQSKARMLLGSSDNPYMKEFTSPKYIKDVQKLVEIYKEVNAKEHTFSTENIKLNTSKMKTAISFESAFSEIEKLEDYSGRFHNLISNYARLSSSECTDSLNSILPKLTVQFKLLSNIITLATEPLEYIKDTDSYVKLLNLFTDDSRVRIAYEDEYSIIFSHEAELTMNDIKNMVIFWEIIVGGRIVYMTASLLSYYEKGNKFHMPFEYVAKPSGMPTEVYSKLSEKEGPYRISKVFSPGDYLQIRYGGYSKSMKIGGAEVPPMLQEDILNKLRCTVIPVAVTSNSSNTRIILLSMVDGTLMICNSNPVTRYEFTEPFDQQYLSVVAIETYGNWSQESKKLIKNTIIKDAGCNELIKQSLTGESTRDILSKKKGAFDELDACFEWNLSKAINDCNIDDIAKFNSKNIKLLLDTKFFATSRKKLEDLESLEKFKDVMLSDGSVIHIKYPNRRSSSMMFGYAVKFYTYLEIPGEPLTTTVECYSSSKSIISIFSTIKSIQDTEAKSYGYLKNEFADPINFKSIWEAPLVYNECKAGLAINRCDGVIYAFVRTINGAFLPLFRFKNSDDAVKFGALLYKDADSYTSKGIKVPVQGLIGQMANYIQKICEQGFEKATEYGFDRMITDARNYVMSGYPNGYIVQGNVGKILDLCAKQPLNLENIE